MARKQLKFRSIADLDPAVAAIFDDYVKLCVKDCQDRPGLDKSRGVRLEVRMKPDADEKGNIDGVLMQIDVSKVMPKQGSRLFSLAANNAGDLAFNDADPTTHHKQMTIDESNPPPSGGE